jgi:hypothetical protein
MYNLKQLRRLRWLVLVTVLLGIGASIAMNVLHAPSNPAARLVAAGPPLAVFFALELIARIPSSSKGLTWFRIAGAVVVALGAATISYAQQRAAVRGLGFADWESFIWPLIIDGLMVVASVSLVEVVRKIRQLDGTGSAPSSPARLRVVGDEFESEEALAYRAAVAAEKLRLRKESSLARMNGGRAA